MEKETLEKIHAWMLGDDTGQSSKFLCQLALGNLLPDIRYPYDPSDFGRCYRFLQLLSEEQQDKVLLMASNRSAEWERLVEVWDELVEMYLKEFPSGSAPELYKMIKEALEPTCDICGGTGEVTTMEQVYAGEPHMAPIGTKKCICRTGEPF
jgi:hypothetical protein